MLTQQIAYWSMREGMRHNRATEKIGRYEMRTNRINARTNQQNADTNVFNAKINAINAQTQKRFAGAAEVQASAAMQNASTNILNANINQQNADSNALNAKVNYLTLEQKQPQVNSQTFKNYADPFVTVFTTAASIMSKGGGLK